MLCLPGTCGQVPDPWGGLLSCVPACSGLLPDLALQRGRGSARTRHALRPHPSQAGAGPLPALTPPPAGLLAGMLEYEPAKRFSIQQIRQHR